MSVIEPNPLLRMTKLCHTFPTLSHKKIPGIYPWKPEELDEWACSGVPSHGALFAARFVLAVWSGRAGKVGKPRRIPEDKAFNGDWRFPVDTAWRCGPFDVVDALGTWDAAHREAFIDWVRDPMWP